MMPDPTTVATRKSVPKNSETKDLIKCKY